MLPPDGHPALGSKELSDAFAQTRRSLNLKVRSSVIAHNCEHLKYLEPAAPIVEEFPDKTEPIEKKKEVLLKPGQVIIPVFSSR